MITLFNIFCWVSGFAFWGFVIYIFAGVQKKALFNKQWHIFGYAISIESQRKKDLTIKITK